MMKWKGTFWRHGNNKKLFLQGALLLSRTYCIANVHGNLTVCRVLYHCESNPNLTHRFPLHRIRAFQPLRDCARLRDRKMSWNVSKRRVAVFIS